MDLIYFTFTILLRKIYSKHRFFNVFYYQITHLEVQCYYEYASYIDIRNLENETYDYLTKLLISISINIIVLKYYETNYTYIKSAVIHFTAIDKRMYSLYWLLFIFNLGYNGYSKLLLFSSR